MMAAGRGYADALEKLKLLQSNRVVTGLFEQPKPAAAAAAASSSPTSASATTQDLNSRAIPEVLTWLRRAGYTPQDLAKMRHIHVAGTKGKGSVCAFATAMLLRCRSGGGGGGEKKVGTYTSPHLISPRERIAIGGVPVGQDVFAEAFFELWDRFTEAAAREGASAEEAAGPGSKPFFFRFLTILAWHIFLREGVEDVVMECGIGGEYDATNVLPAEAVSAAVVAQLGIDHVAMLGGTVEEIAWHKAGIFKRGVRGFVVALDEQPGVMDVLRARAREKGADLVELSDEAVQRWGGVKGALLQGGDFQKRNQALAVMAVRQHLGGRKEAVSAENALRDIPAPMVAGLGEARIRGRGEVVDDGRLAWMLDGAHTRESLEGAGRWLARCLAPDETALLIFNQQERDAPALLAHLVASLQRAAGRGDVFAHAIFARNDVAPPRPDEQGAAPRDTSVQEAAAARMSEAMPGCRTVVVDSTAGAVDAARRLAASLGSEKEGSRRHKVLVTGSLHLVGGVLQALEPESLL